ASKDAQQQQLCLFLSAWQLSPWQPVPILARSSPGTLAAAAECIRWKEVPRCPGVTISTVCWYLKRDGVCPHGDRAAFSHDLSSAVRQDSSKSSAKAQTLQAQKPMLLLLLQKKKKRRADDKASSAAVKESGSGFVISRPAQTRQSPAAASAIPSMATKKSLSGLTEASLPNSVFEFDFQSSDPDWPYDVKSLPLAVAFPIGFPKEAMQVTVRESPQLPRRLLKTCQSGINKWLSERQTNCLKNDCACPVFRQFLRWLDRGLEDLFTTGLQLYKRELEAAQAGISIYTPEQLREKFAQAAAATAESKDSADVREDETEEADDNNDEDDSDEDSSDENEEGDSVQRPSQQQLRDPVRRGTEIALRRLELRDSVASLTVRRLVVELRCSAVAGSWRPPCAFADSQSRRVVSMACAQCGPRLRAGFRPSLLHSFSGKPAVVGFLDLTGCSAEDALLSAGDCEFVTVCLGCQLPHTHHGQLAVTPMRHCWPPLPCLGGFVAEGVRLTVLSAGGCGRWEIKRKQAKQQQKKPKKPIEPDIGPGQPLGLAARPPA
uniref:C3H1-type domain-containing protein n=1 Tax=Macrostomum lignano TaxID=282301 RepID=A0A1I8FNV7_9PLAT